MIKYNKIASISQKKEGEFVLLHKFAMFETPDYDVFVAIDEWVKENIPEAERDDIFCAVDIVEAQEETMWH